MSIGRSDRDDCPIPGLAELQEKLNEALLKLSENHRLVVTLHDLVAALAEENDCWLP